LVAATLRGILAQRLIRKICDACKTSYKLNEYEAKWMEQATGTKPDGIEFFYGKGCNFCNQTGYKGRTAIFELLTLTPEMQEALRIKDPTSFSHLVTEHLKGKMLVDAAIVQIKNGISTISEAMRVVGGKW
jgi:MSHA biogenesis protein MshE